MSVQMWMQREAVHGGHIKHMDTRHQHRAAPQTNAPAGERARHVPDVQSLTDALYRLRLGT